MCHGNDGVKLNERGLTLMCHGNDGVKLNERELRLMCHDNDGVKLNERLVEDSIGQVIQISILNMDFNMESPQRSQSSH